MKAIAHAATVALLVGSAASPAARANEADAARVHSAAGAAMDHAWASATPAGTAAAREASPAGERAAGAAIASASTSSSSPAPESAPARDDRSIDLRSATLVVEHGNRRAVFGGGVTATRGALVLTCPEVVATYDAAGTVRDVTCRGPVEASEGERYMRAQHGVFDNTTGLLTLAGEPTLTEGERRLTGESLIYDVNASTARLTNAHGEIPGADAPDLPGAAGRGPLRVEAATVFHELAERRTRFEGGVIATRGDLVLRADRLTAWYDEDGALDRAITGGGPVRVTQGARRGEARKATFTGGARTLVLTGDPRITEGESSLTGSRATFLLGADRVVVDQPRAVFPVRAVGGSR